MLVEQDWVGSWVGSWWIADYPLQPQPFMARLVTSMIEEGQYERLKQDITRFCAITFGDDKERWRLVYDEWWTYLYFLHKADRSLFLLAWHRLDIYTGK